jgi:hypothetical protein
MRKKVTGNVDIKEMNFIHFGDKIAFGVDDKGSVKILILSFARYGADGVHGILRALGLDGVEGGGVGKIFGVVDHVLFGVG